MLTNPAVQAEFGTGTPQAGHCTRPPGPFLRSEHRYCALLKALLPGERSSPAHLGSYKAWRASTAVPSTPNSSLEQLCAKSSWFPFRRSCPSIRVLIEFESLVLASIDCEYGVQQNVGAVCHVRWCGEFLGGVTDAVDTGHEDHAGRRDPGNVLCVMTRSTGHGFEGEPEVVRRFGDEGAQAGIGGYRGCGPIEFLELDARTSIVRDHLCFRRDPLEKSLDLVGRQVPQFETHDDFSRDHIRELPAQPGSVPLYPPDFPARW